jgi:hypothetical protein
LVPEAGACLTCSKRTGFNYRLNHRTMESELMVRLLRACICTQTIMYKQLVAMPEQD